MNFIMKTFINKNFHMGATICGVFTKVEMMTHFDMQSVGNQRFGLGTDIDSAVLAATSFESAR